MRDFGDWFNQTTRELNKTYGIVPEKTKEEPVIQDPESVDTATAIENESDWYWEGGASWGMDVLECRKIANKPKGRRYVKS